MSTFIFNIQIFRVPKTSLSSKPLLSDSFIFKVHLLRATRLSFVQQKRSVVPQTRTNRLIDRHTQTDRRTHELLALVSVSLTLSPSLSR